MILLRESWSVRELGRRTGMDARVLYRLYNGQPTTWTPAVQAQLEALVPEAMQPALDVLRARYT